MKKYLSLIAIVFIFFIVGFIHTKATDFSFQVFEQNGNQRLMISANNTDFDANINALEFNYGKGWVSTIPLFGGTFGTSGTMSLSIPYSYLPQFAVNIRFRLIDSNNLTHNLQSYVFGGRSTGCDYYYNCPAGSPYMYNQGATGSPIFQESNSTYLGDGVSSNEITTTINTDAYDTVFVATLHYRSTTEQVSNISFYNEYFEFGCIDRSSEYTTEVWYLSGINDNDGDVRATWTGNIDDGFITVAAVSNVSMANPVGGVLCNSDMGWSTSHSIDINTDDTQFVYAGATTYSGNFNDITPDGSMTEVANERVGNVTMSAAYKPADNGTTTMSWTGANSWPWSAGVIVLNGYFGDDSSPPDLTFTSEPDAVEDVNFTIAGTAHDDESNLNMMSLKLYEASNSSNIFLSDVIEADDGNFDEHDEAFTYDFTSLAGGSYGLDIIVIDSFGFYNTYNFSFDVTSDNDAPIYDIENLGQAAMADNTPTWTGSATDTESNLDYIQYRIVDVQSSTVEVDWTNVTVDDGTIDSQSESFSFTSPTLTDGAKYVLIKTADTVGNISPVGQTDYYVDRVIIDAYDLTAPIILVKDVVPNNNPDQNLKIAGKVTDSTRELSSNIEFIYYKLDGGSWTSLNAVDGGLNDEKAENFEVSLSNLSNGAHTVIFRAVDASGNDTNTQSINITKTFTTINEDDSLVPTNIETVIGFNSNSYADFTDSEGLIWGNGRLRLAEQFTPVGTPLSTSTTLYGPKYGFEAGAWNMDRSSTNGYWVAQSGGAFAYYNLDTSTEYNFHTSDYYGGSGPTVYDIKEMVSNGEYHVWLATGDSILGLNLGTSITDGTGNSYVIRDIPANFVRILDIDKRDPDDYGVFARGSGALFRVSDFTFSDSTDNSSTLTEWVDNQGYLTTDITAIYFDADSNDIWLADYTDGISRINDNGTPEDTSDDAETISYPSQIGVFDIGMDDSNHMYFVGNAGLKIISNDGGTPNNSGDDTITTLADNIDLNIDTGAKAVYLPGTFPVEDQFFVSNRSGEIYYISTNGTYADYFDDQIIRLPLVNQYPSAVRDFYMPDENTIVASIQRSGVWSFNLDRKFVESGYTTTKIDPQVANYLNADFVRLESFTRVDSTQAVVSYKASNSGGTTLLTLSPGEEIKFPGDDHRVVFRIEMFRGSTPVLEDVTFSYSAYPTDEIELDQFSFTNLPSSVQTGNTFSFDINALDSLNNPIADDVNATVSLVRSLDDSVIGTFNISNITIENGKITVPNATANVIGNHYLKVVSGGVDATSSTILFTEIPVTPPPSNNNTQNNNSNNSSNNPFASLSTTVTAAVSNAVNQTTKLPTSTPVYDVPVSDAGPSITKFKVNEKVVDGKLILEVEWCVSGAEAVEISGIGENLASCGSGEVEATEGLIVQLTAIDKNGNQSFKTYKAKNVEGKIKGTSKKKFNVICIPVVFIIPLILFFIAKKKKKEDQD